MAELNIKEIAKQAVDEAIDSTTYGGLPLRHVLNKIAAGEYAPMVYGHWIFGEFDGTRYPVECSECGGRTYTTAPPKAWLDYPSHKYCGWCGAKMDGGEENG